MRRMMGMEKKTLYENKALGIWIGFLSFPFGEESVSELDEAVVA